MSTVQNLKVGEMFLLGGVRAGLGLSWDPKSKTKVDLDLQAVLVDKKGCIVDACYYNKLSDQSKSLIHSGDEETGEKGGYDEMIWVVQPKVPDTVNLIIFVIAAYSGGHLNDAENCMINVVEDKCWNLRAQIPIQESAGDVDAVALMKRTREGTWIILPTQQCAENGRHFMDILEPTLGELIRKTIPGAPAVQKVFFPMEKGTLADLPTLKKVYVGVGWTIQETAGKGIDLDISAVFFHKAGRDIGAVYFDNPEEYGLKHNGDNVTGEGSGDDEVIDVVLSKVPDEIAQVFFVVNIYSKDTSFDILTNAYCRVLDQEGHELLRYDLNEQSGRSGLVMARLCRSPETHRWGFQALGKFCGGRTWMDPACMEAIKALAETSMREVQRSPQMHISKLDAKGGADEGVAMPAPAKKALTICRTGSVLDLPDRSGSGKINRIFVGIGWDLVRTARKHADLDVSTVFFNADGHVLGAVYFDNVSEHGVHHSGDNRTGEGEGDDEVIQLDLDQIPVEITQVFFVVNLYSKGMDFKVIQNAYCRVVDEFGNELVRYELSTKNAPKGKCGLVFSRLIRRSNSWAFQAKPVWARGRTWMDPSVVSAMKRVVFLAEMTAISKAEKEGIEDLRSEAGPTPRSARSTASPPPGSSRHKGSAKKAEKAEGAEAAEWPPWPVGHPPQGIVSL